MPIIKRKPANPVPADYAPDGVEAYKVSTGENLQSIAVKFGMGSWQELTRLNWKTDNPDEVNWYLGERVGCTAVSPDGYNYSFRTEDDPGIIYVPARTGPRPGGGTPGAPGGEQPPPEPAGPNPPVPTEAGRVARNEPNVLALPVERLPVGWIVTAPRPKTRFRIWIPTNTGGTLTITHQDGGTVELRRPIDSVISMAKAEITYEVPTGEFGEYHVIARGAAGGKVRCLFVQESFSRDGMGDADPILLPWNFYYWPTALRFRNGSGTTPNSFSVRARAVMKRYATAAGKDGDAAAQWELDNHGTPPVGEGWEGHCHNAAPASILFEQPQAKTYNSESFDQEEMEYIAAEYFGNFGLFAAGWGLRRGSKPGGANGRFYIPAYFKPGGPKTRDAFIDALKLEDRPSDPGAVADQYIADAGGEAQFSVQVTKWLGELAAEFYQQLITLMRTTKHAILSNMRSYRGGGGPHEVWNQAYFYYSAFYQENGDTKDERDLLIFCNTYANLDTWPSTGLPASASNGHVTPDPSRSLSFANKWRVQFDASGNIIVSDQRNEWRSLKNSSGEELFPPSNLLILGRPGTTRDGSKNPFSLGNAYVGTDAVTNGLLTVRKRYQ